MSFDSNDDDSRAKTKIEMPCQEEDVPELLIFDASPSKLDVYETSNT